MAPLTRGRWVGTPAGHVTAATVAACTRLRHAGDWRGSCILAGFQVDVDLDACAAAYGREAARRLAADLAELVPDLLWQYLPDSFHERLSFDPSVVLLSPLAQVSSALPEPPVLVVTLPTEPDTERRPRLSLADPGRLSRHAIRLPAPCWRAGAVTERRDAYTLPEPYAAGEVAALRDGVLSPDDLHPLVHDALYPDRTRVPVAPSWRWPPVRVRCGTVWHEVRIVDGRLDAPHDDQEIDREFAFGGLGGAMSGCAATVRAWRTGQGRLPRRLRWYRTDFFRHALHGHTDDVLAMLDAGFDVAARDGTGATLMHYLGRVDHRRLWPRLREAGLAVDARDRRGRTPLREAVALQAGEVVGLLLDAGADPYATDVERESPVSRQEGYVEAYLRRRDPEQPPPSSILARLRGTVVG